MNNYIIAIALYGVALFAAAVGWEVVTALFKHYRNPPLPFGKPYEKEREYLKAAR